MPDLTPDVIADGFRHTLEELAFIFTQPAPPLPRSEGELAAHVAFEGPQKGGLTVRAPAAFGPVLAANLLGSEPGDPEAEAGGDLALRELLNVAAGRVLKDAFGTAVVCHLGIPAPGAPAGEIRAAVGLLSEDGHHLTVELSP